VFCYLDGLVVVPVHVPHEKVVDGQVHDVQHPPPLVVRLDLLDDLAIPLVRLPVCLATLVVRATPGVTPSLAGSDGLRRHKEEGEEDDKYLIATSERAYRSK
jgi:hypothetical protein